MPDESIPVAPDEVLAAGQGPESAGPGDPAGGDTSKEGVAPRESVSEPAKVLRIGSMVKTLLEEVRQAPLDEKSRTRLREIYEQSIHDLSEGLSPDLVAELERMALPFDEGAPSESELRIAQAQLVGWLEGLFHGIQASIFAQQAAASAQLEKMRERSLNPGGAEPRAGTYL